MYHPPSLQPCTQRDACATTRRPATCDSLLAFRQVDWRLALGCAGSPFFRAQCFDELGDIDDNVPRWGSRTAHARLNRCARRPPWAGSSGLRTATRSLALCVAGNAGSAGGATLVSSATMLATLWPRLRCAPRRTSAKTTGMPSRHTRPSSPFSRVCPSVCSLPSFPPHTTTPSTTTPTTPATSAGPHSAASRDSGPTRPDRRPRRGLDVAPATTAVSSTAPLPLPHHAHGHCLDVRDDAHVARVAHGAAPARQVVQRSLVWVWWGCRGEDKTRFFAVC